MTEYLQLNLGNMGNGFYLNRPLDVTQRQISDVSGDSVLQYELRVAGYTLGVTGFSRDNAINN